MIQGESQWFFPINSWCNAFWLARYSTLRCIARGKIFLDFQVKLIPHRRCSRWLARFDHRWGNASLARRWLLELLLYSWNFIDQTSFSIFQLSTSHFQLWCQILVSLQLFIPLNVVIAKVHFELFFCSIKDVSFKGEGHVCVLWVCEHQRNERKKLFSGLSDFLRRVTYVFFDHFLQHLPSKLGNYVIWWSKKFHFWLRRFFLSQNLPEREEKLNFFRSKPFFADGKKKFPSGLTVLAIWTLC